MTLEVSEFFLQMKVHGQAGVHGEHAQQVVVKALNPAHVAIVVVVHHALGTTPIQKIAKVAFTFLMTI